MWLYRRIPWAYKELSQVTTTDARPGVLYLDPARPDFGFRHVVETNVSIAMPSEGFHGDNEI